MFMIRDIFDREIYVGDFVYAKRESSDGVSTDDMCLVIGENLALSPIVTASFYDTQAKNIIFWFTSALLIKDKNLIERQRWNFLKCRQEHVEYEGGLYDFGGIDHRDLSLDIVGEKIKQGDLVYLDNTHVFNYSVSKLHVGICIGLGKYHVFNSQGKMDVIGPVRQVYKIKDKSSEIEKLRSLLAKHSNKEFILNAKDNINWEKYKGYKPSVGQVMITKDDIFWVYLGDNIKVSLYAGDNCFKSMLGNAYCCLSNTFDEEQTIYNATEYFIHGLAGLSSYEPDRYGAIQVTKKYSSRFIPYMKSGKFYYVTFENFVDETQPRMIYEYQRYKYIIERL